MDIEEARPFMDSFCNSAWMRHPACRHKHEQPQAVLASYTYRTNRVLGPNTTTTKQTSSDAPDDDIMMMAFMLFYFVFNTTAHSIEAGGTTDACFAHADRLHRRHTITRQHRDWIHIQNINRRNDWYRSTLWMGGGFQNAKKKQQELLQKMQNAKKKQFFKEEEENEVQQPLASASLLNDDEIEHVDTNHEDTHYEFSRNEFAKLLAQSPPQKFAAFEKNDDDDDILFPDGSDLKATETNRLNSASSMTRKVTQLPNNKSSTLKPKPSKRKQIQKRRVGGALDSSSSSNTIEEEAAVLKVGDTARRHDFESLLCITNTKNNNHPTLGPMGAAQLVPWVPPYRTDVLIILADPRRSSKDMHTAISMLLSTTTTTTNTQKSTSWIPERSTVIAITADTVPEIQA
jgi:hypothetical protein